jgi:ergothioneine biosynthesis protein EgtB
VNTPTAALAMKSRHELRRDQLLYRYRVVRAFSERLCDTLCAEDYVVQSMPDASPMRWHLAHTTWFYETFILAQNQNYQRYNESFEYLFNSYYNTVGEQYPRDKRGLLTRPTVEEIIRYRTSIDELIVATLSHVNAGNEHLLDILELGLNHEQQHQELMQTDIKHLFSQNPLFPSVSPHAPGTSDCLSTKSWITFKGGIKHVGHQGNSFAFDNESPRHRVFLEPYALCDQLVTNGEFLDFVQDRGYQRAELWLSMGWHHINQHRWNAPLYWIYHNDKPCEFTLNGLKPLDLAAPVTHLSYFEADAYARWAKARLPTESEWEAAASEYPVEGCFAEDHYDLNQAVHPFHGLKNGPFRALFGDCWQWTSSSYSAYPGYQPADGALGEYNGKFMCNQYVLRGGSCATPRGHLRTSYRNFFPADTRWQFTGLRLAKSIP